jgi:methylaspartate mutase sigma subunit
VIPGLERGATLSPRRRRATEPAVFILVDLPVNCRFYGPVLLLAAPTLESMRTLQSSTEGRMMQSATRAVAPGAPRKLRIIVTGTSSDAHTWNLVFLQLLLDELGHDVVNLGPCVPDAMVVERCAELHADALVVSSVNGHGAIDALSLIRELRSEPSMAQLPVVIGGKLGTRRTGGEEVCRALVEAGFNGVFEEALSVSPFTSFVESLCGGAST